MKIFTAIKDWVEHFFTPAPTKPVEPWPFPAVTEDFKPRECCGKCKPAKKVAKKKPVLLPVKTATKKKPAKQSVKKAK